MTRRPPASAEILQEFNALAAYMERMKALRPAQPAKGVPTAQPAKGVPNPSLKRSANGRPPGQVWRYAVHSRQPGPGVLPSSPG
jgi:hypothetical protein